MVEKLPEEQPMVDVLTTFGKIIGKVSENGNIDDIDVWRKTFPDIPFDDIDDMFTGNDVNWKDRTYEEKAVYVAYMKDPQAGVLSYALNVNESTVYHTMEDSERFWYVWFNGTFKNFGRANYTVSEESKDTLLFYAEQTAGDFAKVLEDLIDTNDVDVIKIQFKVKDFTI